MGIVPYGTPVMHRMGATWERLFGTVGQSDFLTGRSGTWNGCGFDRILKPANLVIMILEGNYADKSTQKEKTYDESFRIAATV